MNDQRLRLRFLLISFPQWTSREESYGLQNHLETVVKTGEMYFLNKKLASRKRYEKARDKYTDMPAPDGQLEDFGGELLKDVRAERRQWAKVAEDHVPDPEAAAQIDSFCESMLAKGTTANADSWLGHDRHTLGEYTHAKSRSLVEKLKRAGAKQIHACDIDCYDDDENTGHLVVELPADPAARKSVFREIERLAAAQGYQADFDNGQRYAYVKLD